MGEISKVRQGAGRTAFSTEYAHHSADELEIRGGCIVDVQTKLYSYFRQHTLSDVGRQNGAWEAGPGCVVVNALLAGLWPRE